MCLILHIFRLDTPYLREQGCEDSWLFFEAKKRPVNNNVWDKLPSNILYRWWTEEWIWSFEGMIPIEMNRITGIKIFPSTNLSTPSDVDLHLIEPGPPCWASGANHLIEPGPPCWASGANHLIEPGPSCWASGANHLIHATLIIP